MSLYILYSDSTPYLIKIGTSYCPERRKHDAKTWLPCGYRYLSIFFLPQFTDNDEKLYLIDSVLWKNFLHQYQLQFLIYNLEWYHFNQNFNLEYYLKLLSYYLNQLGVNFNLFIGDPYPENITIHKEDSQDSQDKQDKEIKQFLSLIGKTSLRTIQQQVYFKFKEIFENHTSYDGIIRWPTGVGKTIAILSCLYHFINFNRGKSFLICSLSIEILNRLKRDLISFSSGGCKIFSVYDGVNNFEQDYQGYRVILISHQAMLRDPRHFNSDLIFYDEVHHIVADNFFQQLIKQKPPYLFGSSATPYIQDQSRNENLDRLFVQGVISSCDYKTAIQQHWIAAPEFSLFFFSLRDERQYLIDSGKIFFDRISQLRSASKIICYFPGDRQRGKLAVEVWKTNFPNFNFYSGIDILTDIYTEKQFIETNQPEHHILICCQRNREGIDFSNIEATAVFIKESIERHNLIQVIGRSLRLDYPGKIGKCLVFKHGEGNICSLLEDLFENLNDMELIDRQQMIDRKNCQQIVEQYLHEIYSDGLLIDQQQAIEMIQALYQGKILSGKVSYQLFKQTVSQFGFKDQRDYLNKIEKMNFFNSWMKYPDIYFQKEFISWEDMLSLTSNLPSEKSQFVEYLKAHRITFEKYLSIHQQQGWPAEISEKYHDWCSEDWFAPEE